MKQEFRRTRRTLSTLSILSPIGALALAGVLTACAGSTDTSDTVRVFAAASLNTAADDLAAAFTADHPDADLVFNFAGSPTLVRQIAEGAPADVFISADAATMDTALELPEFTGAQPVVIATNRLVLATAPANPGEIATVADISDDLIALCAPEVPCGALARTALGEAGVQPGRTTEEAAVSDVAMKISTGEVDAGFIYATDAAALATTQDITIIDLEGNVDTTYPLALTTLGRDNPAARAFADFLSSEAATDILTDHGFRKSGTD